MTELDTRFVRSLFPVFQRPGATDLAFFENAGGACACGPVLEHFERFNRDYKVQPYGSFEPARMAGEAMDAGYATIAALLGTRTENLTLGPSTTLNTYVLAEALRHQFAPGDEIVVTNQDHEANIGCWRKLEEFGVLIREWQVDPASGELDTTRLEELVGPRTRLLAFTLSSNVIGTLNPVAEIVAIARRHGALVVGDGVSYAPHAMLDVERSGLDFYLFSTYKTFATHVGVLWGNDRALALTRNQGHFFNADNPLARLNPAGPQHGEIAALAGLGEYFDLLYSHHHDTQAFESDGGSAHQRTMAVCRLFQAHESRLVQRLIDGLTEVPGLQLLGRGSDQLATRSSVVSLRVSGSRSASDIAHQLGLRGIGVRAGHFYAVRLMEAMGIDPGEGVLRISPVHYNTQEEIDRLLAALMEIVG
ncbi:MAG: aminotransferase class V-fold PLP-dependent enzyme [Gammaproteobacteria bacterium]|nr:aminotransferase class V-fold PLP-dependent enzyme [Gammaproteobacteria bacterium]